jgi:hypothetical protein
MMRIAKEEETESTKEEETELRRKQMARLPLLPLLHHQYLLLHLLRLLLVDATLL